jgi:hypothetical protein
MGCKIQNIVPACGYQPQGITDIRLIDTEDFIGFVFENLLYDSCYVTDILYSGNAVTIASPDSAFYESERVGRLTSHSMETFVSELSAEVERQLMLATKRRYLVVFRLQNGKWFTFGYEAGAVVTYRNRTDGGAGSAVRITATSAYPLFEVSRKVFDPEWMTIRVVRKGINWDVPSSAFTNGNKLRVSQIIPDERAADLRATVEGVTYGINTLVGVTIPANASLTFDEVYIRANYNECSLLIRMHIL